MRKRLLTFAAVAMTTLSGFALSEGDMVYTPQGRFKIVDATNLCTNGSFESTTDAETGNVLYSGWNSLDKTVPFASFVAVNPAESNGLTTNSLQCNTFNANYGLYYTLSDLNPNGTYVVSFKVKVAETAVAPAVPVTIQNYYLVGDTIIHGYATVGTTKYQISHAPYVNVIGNAGNSVFDITDVMSVGGPSMLNGEWQTVSYAIEGDGKNRTWYFVLKGMPKNMEIADVQIQEAEKGFDDREGKKILGMAKAIVNAYDWSSKYSKFADLEDDLIGVKENITNVEDANFETDQVVVEDLEDAVNDFLDKYFDNYLNSCAPNTNWPESTYGNYMRGVTEIGDWKQTVNGGRMGYYWNKQAAQREYIVLGNFGVGQKMSMSRIEMTKTLQPGVYVWALDGRRYAQYTNYVNNLGFDLGAMRLFVGDEKSDSITIYAKDHTQGTYVVANVTAPTEVNIGWECYNEGYDSYNNGGSFEFYNPLLRVFLMGEYNSDQLAYWQKVKEQIAKGRTELTTASGYLNNADYVWGKAVLQACVDTVSPKIAQYELLDSVTVIDETYKEGWSQQAAEPTSYKINEIYTNAVRDILAANRTFVAVNDTLNSLSQAIATAKEIRNLRIYSESTEGAVLDQEISTAETLFAQLQTAGYSEENVQTLLAEISKLTEAEETYTAGIPADKIDIIADIDFEQPVSDLTEGNDYTTTAGAATVVGAVNQLKMDNYMSVANDNAFQKGYEKNGESLLPGMLRVGNGSGLVSIDADKRVDGTNILRVSFDMYFGKLSGQSAGFDLLDENDQRIAGFMFNFYNGTTTYDDLGINFAYVPSFGAQNVDNDSIIGSVDNKTHFEVVLDYGASKMYCTTNSKNGVQYTKAVSLTSTDPVATFAVKSTYSNAGRRCWFDNLKIEKITAGAVAVLNGDANGDKEVTMADANAVVNYYLADEAGRAAMIQDGFNVEAANANGDFDESGNPSITMADANKIVNIYLGIEE